MAMILALGLAALTLPMPAQTPSTQSTPLNDLTHDVDGLLRTVANGVGDIREMYEVEATYQKIVAVLLDVAVLYPQPQAILEIVRSILGNTNTNTNSSNMHTPRAMLLQRMDKAVRVYQSPSLMEALDSVFLFTYAELNSIVFEARNPNGHVEVLVAQDVERWMRSALAARLL